MFKLKQLKLFDTECFNIEYSTTQLLNSKKFKAIIQKWYWIGLRIYFEIKNEFDPDRLSVVTMKFWTLDNKSTKFYNCQI